jgi:hypothetical protein
VLAALTGCTGSRVQAKQLTKPSETYSAIVVDQLQFKDKLWEYLGPHFQRGLVDSLNQQKAFPSVIAPLPQQIPPSAVILRSSIVEVDKGNAALRFIVGFGAGQQKVAGNFQISNAQGLQLAEFDADESYAGGLGIGGAGFLDMEDLMKKFGENVALRVGRWSKGLPLEEPGPGPPGRK